ncbi:ABC transporter permease subunit [Candidatus Leptofilum sp.]|uniref:branched-chain amino acid ABC transporter permease n=1 Tax=Candidatus Leptofilum sp. TaxID=3241576 RepID=UPI003B5C5CF7
MADAIGTLRANRTRLITLAVLAFLFFTAVQGMETDDWLITILRGLSVGMITFLVAAGLSLILGLMDVLNLAHGEMFMVGAYVGWTVFVRPDTFVDILSPLLLTIVGFVLLPVWRVLIQRVPALKAQTHIWPWLALILGAVILWLAYARFPLAIWNPEVYAESPITYSLALSQDNLILETVRPPAGWPLGVFGTLLGGSLLALAIAGFRLRRQAGTMSTHISRNTWITAAVLTILGLVTFFINSNITDFLLGISTTARFFVAMLVATGLGFVIGGLIEVALIRPLYDRPIYQLMITLGLSFIVIEVVRAIWGRPEFTMPKAALFSGSGDSCPATSFGDLIANQCSTILLFNGRIRSYNEVFIILVGLVVLLLVWLILQRTRIGMIIRAGVQDSEMVEALGINVRQVFTFVFAMGVGLAALGGILAAPSIGLSTDMGTRLLLLALIALAIGGLTSFPGAAAGAILVGLLQQFIIKYGQIGINLPFLAEPFKPSPPLVPASTVLLMVIILLILPQGLFGRNE